MARVTTINVFEVDRIRVTWIPDHNHYQIEFEGKEPFERMEVNAWRDHGKASAPELVVEWAPDVVLVPELPTVEMDL